jgi:hypothetical protein
LAARAFVSDPTKGRKDAKCRELISPVLVTAALLAEGVGLHADYSISGLHAFGAADWAAIYRDVNVVVVEVSNNEMLHLGSQLLLTLLA